MKFSECIDTWIQLEKLKPDKGQEAKDVYDRAYAEFRGKGLSERAADDQAAVKAVESMGQKVATRKWQKINEMRVSADIFDRFQKSDNPANELYWLGNQLGTSKQRLVDYFQSLIAKNLEKYRPRGAGLWRPIDDMDEIVRASYGEKTASEAKALYDEHAAVHEAMRKRMNLEGTNLFPDPKGRIALQQERGKIIALERNKGQAVAKAEWAQRHLDGMDWDVVERDGDLIPEDEREAFLSKLYDDMRYRGKLNRKATQQFSMALAQKLSHPEYFYYKDADTWLAMNRDYGAGNVYQQLNARIAQRANEIAILEHLGPNPVTMQNFLKNVADKRSAEVDQATGNTSIPQRTMVHKTEKELRSFEGQYAIVAGEVPTGDSILAQSVGTAKNVVSPLILPMAFISNHGDVAAAFNTLNMHKIPASGYLGRLLKNFMTLPTKERRLAAIQNVAGMQSAVDGGLLHQRYNGIVGDGLALSNRFSEVFFRGSFMNALTQAEKLSWTEHLLGAFANSAKKRLDEVPFSQSLKDFGITPDEWDKFRATPIHEPDGQHLLRPYDMLQRTDIDPVEAQRTADKFMDWVVDTSFRGAPQPSLRIQVALGHASDPNTVGGAALRTFGFIKSFASMTFMTYLKDAMAVPTGKGKAYAVARYMLYMTLAGAYITQMKEIIKGNDPMDMNPLSNPTFWIRAALNGGSMGFLGDVVFGTLGAYQHGGLSDIMSGPLPQFLDSVKNLTLDDQIDFATTWAQEGQEAALNKYRGMKDLAALVTRYNPTPWQFKLVLQRALLDDALRLANPRAYNAMEQQKQSRETAGQGSWWGVGEKTPTRLPNLGAAFGGSQR